ncbi:hypothetical protein ABIA19_005411 [Sinorhizobium fredii]
MGDEIGEVAALRQVTGKGCGRIEDDKYRAGLQLVDNAGCHLADRRVRHSKDHDLGTVEGGVEGDRLEPELLCQSRFADLAHLDVTHIEARALEVLGQPAAHLAAGTQQGNRSHLHLPHVVDGSDRPTGMMSQ